MVLVNSQRKGASAEREVAALIAIEKYRDNYDLIFGGAKKPDDSDKVGTIDRVVKQITDGANVPPGGI